jgi:hypothetical protein
MSTIEDILNVSDSDSDGGVVDTRGIDLEGLLDGDDSDEEKPSSSVFPKKASSKSSTISSTISGSQNTSSSTIEKTDIKPAGSGISSSVEPIAELLAALEAARPAPIAVVHTVSGPDNIQEAAPRPASPPSDSSDSDHNEPPGGRPTQTVSGSVIQTTANDNGLLGALDMARRREQRHVAAGNRDVVTALYAKMTQNGGSALSHLKNTDLEAISSQLRRNAQYKQHGPGTAMVLYVQLKFIAIGTSRGLILLFDHFQEIRQVIGSNAVTAAQTVKTNAGVSAIDATPQADVLVAGYENGEVLLWDVAKGVILKRLSELHRSKVVRLRFIYSIGDGGVAPPSSMMTASGVVGSLLNSAQSATQSSDLSIVSVDGDGVVHRVRFTKVIWTSYTIDNDCLLDGKTGPVLDLTVLPVLPTLSRLIPAATGLIQSRTVGSSKAIPEPNLSAFAISATTQWTAFSTGSRTYIVQVPIFLIYNVFFIVNCL